MCGRYYIEEDTLMELEDLVKQIDKKLNHSQYHKDIVPTAMAPILTSSNQELEAQLYSWGFQSYDKKGLLINARAETVMEKKTFQECMHTRRCAVVASGFYEWDKSRNKFRFMQEQSKLMLMAGLYNEEGRFVILTTKANASMEPVHDRMPLVLPKKKLAAWLQDEMAATSILKEEPPLLKKHTDMEQMRLEFF